MIQLPVRSVLAPRGAVMAYVYESPDAPHERHERVEEWLRTSTT